MSLDRRVAAALDAMAGLCTDRSAEVAARPAMSGEPLVGLFAFFDDVTNGRIDGDWLGREAAAWAELVAARWSPGHTATARVQHALDLLVERPHVEESFGDIDEGLGPLARAAFAVQSDSGARPALWRRLHADGVWLGVLGVDNCRNGIEFRFLTVRRGGAAFVLGASTEADLVAILGDHAETVRRTHAPGHHLSRIWPREHHLVLDAGTRHVAVLSPAEVVGLPGGPMIGVGDVDAIAVRNPDPLDWRHGRLAAMEASIDRCATIEWQCIGDDQDVLVVTAAEPRDIAAVMARVADAAPRFGFGGGLAVPADSDLGRRLLRG